MQYKGKRLLFKRILFYEAPPFCERLVCLGNGLPRRFAPCNDVESFTLRKNDTGRVWEVWMIDQLNAYWLSGLPDKSKNRRLPPAVHARRKEERKNEKLNLSNYILPFKF